MSKNSNLCRNCIKINHSWFTTLHKNRTTRITIFGDNSVIEKFKFQYNK